MPDGPRKRILVVEDDEAVRGLITKALESSYEVTAAADGLIATELLSSGPIPDLVIADVMMPHVDGITLTRRMKSDARLARVPVILLSAKTGPRAIIRGIQAGAKLYIEKPFVLSDLVARVKQILK